MMKKDEMMTRFIAAQITNQGISRINDETIDVALKIADKIVARLARDSEERNRISASR